MMQSIKRAEGVRVISEPGDGTRYDFYVLKDGPDNFCFTPCGSTFRFPQKLNYYEACNARNNQEELSKLAHRENCNPHTLRECIRVMIDMEDGKIIPDGVFPIQPMTAVLFSLTGEPWVPGFFKEVDQDEEQQLRFYSMEGECYSRVVILEGNQNAIGVAGDIPGMWTNERLEREGY